MEPHHSTQNMQFEELAGIVSTWPFHFLLGLFNVSVLLTVFMKYGAFIASTSLGESFYALLFSLVSLAHFLTQLEFVLSFLPVSVPFEQSGSPIISGPQRQRLCIEALFYNNSVCSQRFTVAFRTSTLLWYFSSTRTTSRVLWIA